MEMVAGHVVAVLAAWSLAQVVVWRLGGATGWGAGWMALIGGVLGAYALDRLVDATPLLSPSRRRGFVISCVAVMCAGGAFVAAGLVCEPRIWLVVAGLSVVAAAYVPLKRWAPKGLLVAGAWGVACVWLPCGRAIGAAEGALVAVCIALVVLANVVLCDTLDVEVDRSKGVVGVAPWLGERHAAVFAAVLAVIGGAASVVCGVWPLACAAGPLVVMGWLGRRGRVVERRWGRLGADVVMVLPGLAVAAVRAAG